MTVTARCPECQQIVEMWLTERNDAGEVLAEFVPHDPGEGA